MECDRIKQERSQHFRKIKIDVYVTTDMLQRKPSK